MALLKNIEWVDNSSNTIVYKFDVKNDQINKGSALTVRESQVAIFVEKGKLADVFLPGFYKLDTSNMPILSKLMSWKYGFQTPFKSDIYFVNTKQFTNQKWGTINPIMIRDKDYGAVRVRGYGSYSFRVKDAYVFMNNLSGTRSNYQTSEITDYLRSIVVSGISDAIGESKIPLLDMAGNLQEMGALVETKLEKCFADIGLEIAKFVFENFSLPEELEKAMDKNASLSMMRNNMDVYSQMAAADAMKEAAKNQGTLGAGMGMGMGIGMGNMFGNMVSNNANAAQNSNRCTSCNAAIVANAKFCPECGAAQIKRCSGCKAELAPNAKFCPECGTKA